MENTIIPKYESVSVALTTQCNANCIMCWRRKILGVGYDMTESCYRATKKFISAFRKGSLVFLSTGEPTLSSHIGDFLLFCAEHEYRVLLYSNAQVEPRNLEGALRKGLKITFGFSVDGGTNSVLSRIQKGCILDNTLATISVIARLKKLYKCAIDINYIINAENVHSIRDLLDKLPDGVIRHIFISPMKYFQSLEDPKLRECILRYREMDLSLFWKEISQMCEKKGIILRVFGVNEGCCDFTKVCLSRNKMLVIDVDGNILPCVGTEKYFVGNVKTDSLLNLVGKHQVQDLFKALANQTPLKCCNACSLSLKNQGQEYYL